MNDTPPSPFKMSDDQKFEALKMRYEDHVELLRYMTTLDFQSHGQSVRVTALACRRVHRAPVRAT